MQSPQIGYVIQPTNGFSQGIVRSWLDPIIKFEDAEKWNSTDVLIVRGMVRLIQISSNSHLAVTALVKRIAEEMWIKDEYITANILRLLRSPPTDISGNIAGISFRDY